MGNDLKQPATVKERAVRRWEESLGFRISLRVTVVLIPFLVLLIVVSCILSVRSISSLNDKLLDVQTDYAVSIVDDFFSSKLAVVSMFENNDDLQAYFQAVSVPQDIEGYEDREKIQELLSMVLEKMGDEMVAEAWAADARTDRYLLSGGGDQCNPQPADRCYGLFIYPYTGGPGRADHQHDPQDNKASCRYKRQDAGLFPG